MEPVWSERCMIRVWKLQGFVWKGEGQTWGQKIAPLLGVSFYPGILNLEHVAELPFLPAPTLEAFFICRASVSHVFQIKLPFHGFHLMSGPSQENSRILPYKVWRQWAPLLWQSFWELHLKPHETRNSHPRKRVNSTGLPWVYHGLILS